MITVIAGTNRIGSKTEIVGQKYFDILKSKTEEEVRFYSLQKIPLDVLNPRMYEEGFQSKELAMIQDELFVPADKWVIVVPEYNGSYPGVLKLFIDALSVRKYKETFKNKKLAIIGLAAGRGGNSRGLDQLTNSMNYLGFTVLANKLPLSLINTVTDETSITDQSTIDLLESHVTEFVRF